MKKETRHYISLITALTWPIWLLIFIPVFILSCLIVMTYMIYVLVDMLLDK